MLAVLDDDEIDEAGLMRHGDFAGFQVRLACVRLGLSGVHSKGGSRREGRAVLSFRGRGALLLAVRGEDAKGDPEGPVDGLPATSGPVPRKVNPSPLGSRDPPACARER